MGQGPAGAWSVDTRTWRVQWSEEACRIHDAPASSAPTVWEALEFIDLADRAALFSDAVACFLQGRAFAVEVGLTTAAGRRRRVLLTGELSGRLPDGGRTVCGTIALLHDLAPAPDHPGGVAELLAALRSWELVGRAIPRQLRSPLSALRGLALAVRHSGEPLAEGSRRSLERMAATAADLEGKLDGLERLAPLSTQALRDERVDLGTLAQASIEALRRAEPDRQVQVRIEKGLHAHGDPDLLRLALDALLHNAWTFTRAVESPRITFERRAMSGQPTYAVRDNGIGFDMAHAPRLFAPFERLHGHAGPAGSGMGLVIARRAIERHGGSLWAYAAPDQGASFLFTLGQAG